MNKFTVNLTAGGTRTVTAERYEEAFGSATFYDDNGDEVTTLAPGTGTSINSTIDAS